MKSSTTRNPHMLLCPDPCSLQCGALWGAQNPGQQLALCPSLCLGWRLFQWRLFLAQACDRNASHPLPPPFALSRGNEVPQEPSLLGPHHVRAHHHINGLGAFAIAARQSLGSQVEGGAGVLPSALQVPPAALSSDPGMEVPGSEAGGRWQEPEEGGREERAVRMSLALTA